jgi:hypothetical protein
MESSIISHETAASIYLAATHIAVNYNGAWRTVRPRFSSRRQALELGEPGAEKEEGVARGVICQTQDVRSRWEEAPRRRRPRDDGCIGGCDF